MPSFQDLKNTTTQTNYIKPALAWEDQLILSVLKIEHKENQFGKWQWDMHVKILKVVSPNSNTTYDLNREYIISLAAGGRDAFMQALQQHCPYHNLFLDRVDMETRNSDGSQRYYFNIEQLEEDSPHYTKVNAQEPTSQRATQRVELKRSTKQDDRLTKLQASVEQDS